MPVDQLIAERRDEAIAAAALLGVAESDVISLGFSDGALRAGEAAARAQVNEILRERKPDEVYVTYRRDAVADHVASADIVNACVAEVCPNVTVYEYPVWYWAYWPFAPRADLPKRGVAATARHTARCVAALRRESLVRVPIGEHRSAKWAALQLHATQMLRRDSDASWPTLGDVWKGGFLDCFFDTHELFIRRDPSAR